jgi:hypothetical protein
MRSEQTWVCFLSQGREKIIKKPLIKARTMSRIRIGSLYSFRLKGAQTGLIQIIQIDAANPEK